MTDQDRREESDQKVLPRATVFSGAQTYAQERETNQEAPAQSPDTETNAVQTNETVTESGSSDEPTAMEVALRAAAAESSSESDEDAAAETQEASAPESSTQAELEAAQPESSAEQTEVEEEVADDATVVPNTPTEVTAEVESDAVSAADATSENEPEVLPETPTQPETELATAETTEVTPDPQTEASVVEGEAGETAGASFTPVEDDDEARPRRLKDLEVGQDLEGRVTSIALYGVFVDVGVGRDGLVHISEMSDTRIDSPSDVVQIGDTVSVRVKGIDVDARRISLTMRSGERSRGRKRPDIDRDALSTLKVGDTVEGVITGMAPFGAFADIGVGKDGLIHISELSEGRVDKPEDAVQVGEQYTFKLLEVDPEGTRISLSLRRALRTQRLQQLESGQILDGTVSGLAQFGAFVDIGVGRDGLVHISELSEGRVEKVEDVVQVGDPVKVRVLEVNPQSKRISLTMLLEDRPPPAEPEATSASHEGRRRDEGGRGSRASESGADTSSESYSVGDDAEDDYTEGNATLEDLLNKFGGTSSKRKDRRRNKDEDEEDEDDRFSRRQRDAIRRTLQQVSNDE